MVEKRSQGARTSSRPALEWPESDYFRILSIDGGGIRGILPAAILSRLEQEHLQGQSIGQYFDLIAGTSTGGIIALGLATGLTATEILDIYVRKGGDIFPPVHGWRKWLKNIKHYGRSKLDAAVLHKLLDDTFGKKQFWETQNRLCIPSMEGTFGEVFIYKTPHHPVYKKDWPNLCADIAKATSAAPTFFHAFANSGYVMVDGGVWANNPIMIALTETLTSFNVPRSKVRILSLGCGCSDYIVNEKKINGGKLHWTDIFDGVSNLSTQNATGQAGLLIGPENLLRINPPPFKEKIELDDWEKSKELLPPLAAELLKVHQARIGEMFLYGKAKEYKPLYNPQNLPPAE